MIAAGFGLVTVGYALLWTGVQRFRKINVSLLEALGMPNTGTVSRVETGIKPSSDTSGGTTTAQPA